ncbi:transposase [Streptomyces atratus]|uniref:transposase n=1 Tax=Streptomyces atratus TaxID=1893 RepID=UPI0036BEEE4C
MRPSGPGGVPAETVRGHGRPEVLHQLRAEQQTTRWKERYKMRVGVEGTISQGVRRCGLRRSRYRGHTRTSPQHRLA